jgi:transcriptional regulator with XRE-family HTH domain
LTLLSEQGKQQKEMCRFVGVSANVVARWKTGESVSFIQYTDKLASFFGVTADYLLSSSENREMEATLTDREAKMIKQFRNMEYDKQEVVIKVINYMLK